MVPAIPKNLTVYLAGVGLSAFIVMSLFGLGYTAGMAMNDHGDMAGCIFTGQTMLCNMDITEHIALWQMMFTAIHQNIATLLALALLLIATIRIIAYDMPTQRLYLFQHPHIPLFDSLRRAFARGIIHPTIYEFATL